MKIQAMSDSHGTFSVQSIDAEENAQILFASVLPLVELPESNQQSDFIPYTNVDCLTDSLSQIMNTPQNVPDHRQLQQADVTMPVLFTTDTSDTLLAMRTINTIKPQNEINTADNITLEINDLGYQMVPGTEPALRETNPNLLPNVLEQINTAFVDVKNALKPEDNVHPETIAPIDNPLFKKDTLVTGEINLFDQLLNNEKFEQKDLTVDRTLSDAVLVPLTSFANRKFNFPNVSPGLITENPDDEMFLIRNSGLNPIDTSANVINGNEIDKTTTVTELAGQNNPSYDTLLTNVAEFFNKRLAIMEPSLNKGKAAPVLITEGAYHELENNSAIRAFQYSANGVPTSLKVDSYFATLKVYPPDLGQITAEIQVNKGMTELTLRADNPQVKHFIETSLQQLRESFENSNISLGQVSIENNSPDDRNNFQKNHSPGFDDWGVPQKSAPVKQELVIEKQRSNSIIDTYA